MIVEYSLNIKKVLTIFFLLAICNVGLGDDVTNREITAPNIVYNNTRILELTNENWLGPAANSTTIKRMFEVTNHPTRFIILHYTVTPNIDKTMDAFYNYGVSAHFTIDRDGKTYQHVKDDNTAYHAGLSSWQDTYHINWYSLGIEQINTGFDVNSSSNNLLPFKEADNLYWEIWPAEQVKKTAVLANNLARKKQIKPWNIVGHSDIAPGRKVDPGPLFPWKELHTNYNMGFWPHIEPTITKEVAATLEPDDYIHFLHAIGYSVPGFSSSIENKKDLPQDKLDKAREMDSKLNKRQVIISFQYHYLQNKFTNDHTYRSGKLDEDTQLMILNCINSIVKIADKEDYTVRYLQQLIAQDTLSYQARELVKKLLNLQTTQYETSEKDNNEL